LARDLAAGWDALVGPNLEVFVNDARTTTFLALRVGTASPIDPSPWTSPGTANASGSWKGAYSAVNGVMRERGYPQFYEDPKPHASFAWTPGDKEAELREAIEGLGLRSALTARVTRVAVKVSGQPEVTVWARATGKLPPPDV
jgi:hypothetical protein